MKHNYKNPGTEFPAKLHQNNIRNIPSLLDVNINPIEVNRDIVLNIRLDGNQLYGFLKSIIKKSFSEEISLAEQNSECTIEELHVKEKELPPKIWINDKNYLTNREVEIIEKLSKGLLNKEIADSLGLSLHTVKNHLKNIFRKLGIGNRAEAIVGYSKIKASR